jgi:hypothetical protein
MTDNKGSILMGMFWMFIISILLIWLPPFGPLIAGFVGGKVSGGMIRGFTAALLPGILLAGCLFASGSLLTGLPFIGAIVAGGGILLYLLYIPVLLIGALIGGLMA